jgi:hypothetical protein
MRVSRPSNPASWARRRRHENGKVNTHCRSPLDGGSSSENGAPYVVSELLEGQTLREALSKGALPESKAIEFGVQIANGMAAAQDYFADGMTEALTASLAQIKSVKLGLRVALPLNGAEEKAFWPSTTARRADGDRVRLGAVRQWPRGRRAEGDAGGDRRGHP